MDLSDYTILDLSRLLPGPYGTMLLGDLGAEIIKIEEPERGDYARWFEPRVDETGYSAMFHAVNRNKSSVTVDLKDDRGRAAFLELAREADVVFEQFRPGVVDRLGIDYDTVAEYNEDVVYCSLSGYGQTGPYRDRVGHDINYVSLAGLAGMTRSEDGEMPAVPGYPIGDMVGGLFGVFAITAALLSRENGDGGEYLDVSMTDVVVSLATRHAWKAFRDEGVMAGVEDSPFLGFFETADDRYVSLAAVEDQFNEAVLAELAREDLAEPFAAGEFEHVERELAAEFADLTLAECEDTFSDDVPFAPVTNLEEMVAHPQVQARELIRTIRGDNGERFDHIGIPLQTSDGLEWDDRPAPALGADTREVLGRVLDDGELAALAADDVI